MNLANGALRSSPKFTIEVKYVFHHVFDQISDQKSQSPGPDRKHLRVNMEKYEAFRTDRQNKKYNCARKSGRRKNYARTDKEEENKLAGPLVKKELPSEECSRRNVKREESLRHKKISDDRQYHDKWTAKIRIGRLTRG